jgi:DNA-binding response OmpR family regulator
MPDAAPTPLTERILVIEDDRAIQRALKRLFEAEDYGVHISGDGCAGLETFRSVHPSLVILDLRLPGMPGRELCREMKEKAPHMPIIVLSAKTDVADKVLLLELGADDYVTKPFSPRELVLRIKKILDRGQTKTESRVWGCDCRFHENGADSTESACRTDTTGI